MRRYWSFPLLRSRCHRWVRIHWVGQYQFQQFHHCFRPKGHHHCLRPWWILLHSYSRSFGCFHCHCLHWRLSSHCHSGFAWGSFDDWSWGSALTESWSLMSCWVEIWRRCYSTTGSMEGACSSCSTKANWREVWMTKSYFAPVCILLKPTSISR